MSAQLPPLTTDPSDPETFFVVHPGNALEVNCDVLLQCLDRAHAILQLLLDGFYAQGRADADLQELLSSPKTICHALLAATGALAQAEAVVKHSFKAIEKAAETD